MLPAHSCLGVGPGAASLLGGDVDQPADAVDVQALEGRHREDALVQVGGEKGGFYVVPGETPGCLGEVVCAEGEKNSTSAVRKAVRSARGSSTIVPMGMPSDALDRMSIAGEALDIAPLDRSFRLSGRAWTLRYGPVGEDRGTAGDYVDDLDPGDVVVLDNQTRLNVTVGATCVEPGDLLLGDGDGPIAIPASRAAEVLTAAEEIERAEEAIRRAVEAGASLREARRTHGYNDLQHSHDPPPGGAS